MTRLVCIAQAAPREEPLSFWTNQRTFSSLGGESFQEYGPHGNANGRAAERNHKKTTQVSAESAAQHKTITLSMANTVDSCYGRYTVYSYTRNVPENGRHLKRPISPP